MLSSASVSRWVRNNQLSHQLVNQQKVTSATIAASHSLVAALSPFTEKTISRLNDNTTGWVLNVKVFCWSCTCTSGLHLWWYRQCLPDILHISYIYYQHINVTLMLPDVFTCNRSEKSPVYCFGCMILYIYLRSFANTFQLLIPMSEH